MVLASIILLTVFLELGNQTNNAIHNPLKRLSHIELSDGFPDTSFIVIHKATSDPYEPEYDMVNDFAFISKHPCWIDEGLGQTWFLFRPRLSSVERREVLVSTKECDDPLVPSTCDEEGKTIMKIIVSKFTLPYKVRPENVSMRLPPDSNAEAYAEYMQLQDSRWRFDGQWRPWPPPTISAEHESISCLHPRDIPYPQSLARFVLFRGSMMSFRNFSAVDPFGDSIKQRRLEHGRVASWPVSSFYVLPVVDDPEENAASYERSPQGQFEKAYDLVQREVAHWGLIPVLRNAPRAWKPVPLRQLKNLVQTRLRHGTWVGMSTARGIQKLKLSSHKRIRQEGSERELRMDLEFDPDSLLDWDNDYENGHANSADHYYGLDSKGENHWRPREQGGTGRGQAHGESTPLELRADLYEWVTDEVITMTWLNFASQLLSTFTGMKALVMMIFPTVLTLPMIFKPQGPLKFFYADRSRGTRAQLLRLLLEEPLPEDELELSEINTGRKSEDWPGDQAKRDSVRRDTAKRSTKRTTREGQAGESADAEKPETTLINQESDAESGSFVMPAAFRNVSESIRKHWYGSKSKSKSRSGGD